MLVDTTGICPVYKIGKVKLHMLYNASEMAIIALVGKPDYD